MSRKDHNSSRLAAIGLLGLVGLALVAAASWKFWEKDARPPAEASAEVVSAFFASLAALDVEENERAVRLLKDTVQRETREPALWANLAVAQLRLRDLESAFASLKEASELEQDSRELTLLHAELLEQAGEIEPAIEQLRKVHQVWPENIAATYSLVAALGQLRSEAAERERLELLQEILAREPENLRARNEQARIAAATQAGETLRSALEALTRRAAEWPQAAREQLDAADLAAQAGDFPAAARALLFFENLVKPLPGYQQSLAQLGVSTAASVGTPLRRFLKLALPLPAAAEADGALTFALQELPGAAGSPDLVLALDGAGERSSTLLLLSGDRLQAGETTSLPFPGSSREALAASVAVADLNFDFQQDLILAGKDGVSILLGRPEAPAPTSSGSEASRPAGPDSDGAPESEGGLFTPAMISLAEFAQPWRGVWAADVEADGDLDLLLSDFEGPLRWIRNNGDMTFTASREPLLPAQVRELRGVDFDADGDLDLATLDTGGTLAIWNNERLGEFAAANADLKGPRIAFAVGDVDRDGSLDVVSLLGSGEIRFATCSAGGVWSESLLATWSGGALANAAPGDAYLAVLDLDNNGAVDLIASSGHATACWLRSADGDWIPLKNPPALRITSITDLDDDGLLDLVGFTESGPRLAVNQSQAGYGWQVVQPRANTAAGDRRINSFGLGGRIEMRAGNLVQAAAIQSPRVHFGLGRQPVADVARIVWPNGTTQAEFELPSRAEVVATQRLKGSCPWVFAFDGKQFQFVKDFLWRSPLGLRINAQSTAGVVQTEDWIKIGGRQLAAVRDRYSLRITAELWETHFFDHVSLMAVDHPEHVEILVDERFVPHEAPVPRVIVAAPPQPVRHARDHLGNALDDVLRSVDAVYADRFELGAYQGVTTEHWVEFDGIAESSTEGSVLLVGHGWVYPTDSSLNVALAQGSTPPPFGLVLEQQVAGGSWETVLDGLGFPAGKEKDVVIAVPRRALAESRRFRLRTNMEVYWDFLGWSDEKAGVETHVTRLQVQVANLRSRGYSKLLPIDRRRPDTPLYEVIATGPRWLDLEGYYTRFGDVSELLAETDDRYVIMNAGDELELEFETGAAVPKGWRRDFVLIGDGWVKDGDFNTAFSRSVGPLPRHDARDYAGPLVELQQDPVYLRHPRDWQVFHTRYVSPGRFPPGLRPASPPVPGGGHSARRLPARHSPGTVAAPP